MVASLKKNKGQLLVKDVMNRGVVSVYLDSSVQEAKDIMRSRGFSGIPVVDSNSYLLGIISVADIILALENNALEVLVKEYMTSRVISINENASVGQALRLFHNHKFGRFPVVNNDSKVVGIITQGDVIGRLAGFLGIDEEPIGNDEDQGNSKEFISQVFEYPIRALDFDRTGEGASTLKKILTDLGVNKHIIRRSAIAAYEAEINVMIHAREGKMTANISPQEITIIVEDKGPGIQNIPLAMRKGYSTADYKFRQMGFGAGMGLPNIEKSADKLFIENTVEGLRLIIKIVSEEVAQKCYDILLN